MVSRIISNGNWSLTIPALTPIWDSITNISISEIGTEDQWIWTATNSGVFSYKSAWNMVILRGEGFKYFDMVWVPSSSPKMFICLLKGFFDRLPTRSWLKKFAIIDYDHCTLCDNGIETIEHLFFSCPFSAYLWSLCKLKPNMINLAIGNLTDEADQIRNVFKRKDKGYKLARIALQATVWHIWQERNRRIFQRQKLHKVLVFRRIYEDINILLRNVSVRLIIRVQRSQSGACKFCLEEIDVSTSVYCFGSIWYFEHNS